MTKPVGGRGKKAPYETIQMRVPVPIKSEVEKLIEQYRAKVLNGETLVDVEQKPVNEFIEKLVQEVLTDPAVTRNGKDRGSVKRAMEAFLKKLSNFST